MSWKATAWAKETRGHKGYGSKLVLYTLADYHNTERDMAWPSHATIALDCEMPERTVRHEIRTLERAGFVTTLRKGNQHRASEYRLNFDVVVVKLDAAPPASRGDIATAQSYEPAMSEPAMVAAAGEPAISDMVNRQYPAGEPAMAEPLNLQEPPLEPPLRKEYTDLFESLKEVDHWELDTDQDQNLITWIIKNDIDMAKALETADSMASRLQYDAKKQRWGYTANGVSRTYANLRSTFRTWVRGDYRANSVSRRGAQSDRGQGTATVDDPFAKYG